MTPKTTTRRAKTTRPAAATSDRRVTAHEPPAGAQTEAEGVAAPARTPAERPSQDTSADDGSTDVHDTARAVVRSILAALPLDVRAAVVAAVLAWCRSLAAVAGMVGRRELGAVEALPLADTATETLMERDGAPPSDVVGAMLGAWWATGPYDLARQVSRGTTSAEDFADALAFLVQLQGDADALAFVAPGAERDAPAPVQVIRCEMPEGVDRIATRDGRVFLPKPLTLDALDALTRDVARTLGGSPAPRELVSDARSAALDVHGRSAPVAPACTLVQLGAALAALTADAAEHAQADEAALAFADAADGAATLADLTARAFRAARAVCMEAVAREERRVDMTRWPAE